MDAFGGGSKRLARWVDQAENGQRGVGQRREHLGQAGTLGVVTILVPPAVLDEMEAVFHLPVAANIFQQFPRRDGIGIEAGNEVPAFAGKKRTIGRTQLTIGTGSDFAAGDVQMFP